MITFAERTENEKDIIRKAYRFEIEAIEELNFERNPYFNAIKAMEDGKDIWEAINIAIELKYL